MQREWMKLNKLTFQEKQYLTYPERIALFNQKFGYIPEQRSLEHTLLCVNNHLYFRAFYKPQTSLRLLLMMNNPNWDHEVTKNSHNQDLIDYHFTLCLDQ